MKLTCDRCGKTLLLDENVRYKLKVEIFAAYDPMEITQDDLAEDHRDEIRRLLERLRKMDPQAAQDAVHRVFEFDLCMECQREYIKNPLGRKGSLKAD